MVLERLPAFHTEDGDTFDPTEFDASSHRRPRRRARRHRGRGDASPVSTPQGAGELVDVRGRKFLTAEGLTVSFGTQSSSTRLRPASDED